MLQCNGTQKLPMELRYCSCCLLLNVSTLSIFDNNSTALYMQSLYRLVYNLMSTSKSAALELAVTVFAMVILFQKIFFAHIVVRPKPHAQFVLVFAAFL